MADNFVAELVEPSGHVSGLRLTANKYLVLFLKCLYIRKRKKIVTLIELLVPLLIFYYAIWSLDNVFHMTKWQPSKGRAAGKDGPYLFNSPRYIQLLIYYDFNVSNVVATELDGFLKDAFVVNKDRDNYLCEFQRKPLDQLNTSDYTALYFNKFKPKQIDYEMRIGYTKPSGRYNHWKYPDRNFDFSTPGFSSDITRNDADWLHEGILRQMAIRLNPKTANYTIDFDLKINLYDDSGLASNQTELYNPKVFQAFLSALFFSFFINCLFVLTSVCEEKKSKSFDFLRLMGASDGQIFFGHFLNHMLFWLVTFAICLLYLANFLGGRLMPPKVTIILALFGFLYLAHLIVFLFLISAPFKRYLYPELLNILIFYFCFSSLTEKTYQSGFMGILKLAHPLNMLIRLQKIAAEVLCSKFTFRDESLLDIFSYTGNDRELSLFHLLLIDLLFIVIECLLLNYIIQVNPLQSGVRKPFFYFLTPQYWRRTEPVTEYRQANSRKEFEKMPSGSRPAVILKGVDKWFRSWLVFGKFQVLKGFDFAIYENQITVLLGHNGAGKSTTMDLIAGLSCADQGSITVKGIPVSGYTSEFKQKLGYCPQENVFYPSLTVFENLKIAAVLKGLSLAAAPRKIHLLAEKFDLLSKLGAYSKNLSGGMKRRLCLAMAVIGYNDVLVIDEPTSGLDPETRRKIWEILLELRKHKTILLTTHFMEEADILGDRIAIMYDGRVKCCGSTIFLKQLYHVGYLLRVQVTKERAAAEDGEHLLALIRQHIEEASLENQRANELFFRLTVSDTENAKESLNLMIARLLDAFESTKIKKQYGIEAYGLTNTSLEDVFIKIGTLGGAQKNAIAIEERAEDHPLHDLQRLSGLSLYLQQFWAIQCKKFKMNYRSIALFFQSIYLLLPLVVLVMGTELSIDRIFQTDDVSFETFNLKQLKGSEVLIVRNASAGTEESDLFRPANLKWITDEYGLKVVESTKNSQGAIADEMLKWSRAGLKERLVVLPERNGTFTYRSLANPFKLPYTLMGVMEMFYRMIAREAGSDFDVNLKFSFSRPSAQGNQSDEGRRSWDDFMNMGAYRVMFAIAGTFCISLMLSFAFVAFVELPNEEMNSGALSMQIIAGLSKTMYWLGNLMFDFAYCLFLVAIACLLVCFFVEDQTLSPHIFALFGAFTLAVLNCLLVTYFLINLSLSKELTDSIIKWSLFVTGMVLGVYDVIYSLLNMPSVLQIVLQEEALAKGGEPVQVKRFNVPFHFLFLALSPVYNVLDTIFHLLDLRIVRICKDEMKTESCVIYDARDYDFVYNAVAYLLLAFILITLIWLVNGQTNSVLRVVEALKVSFLSSRAQETHARPRTGSRSSAGYLSNVNDPNVEEEAQLAQLLIETNSLQSNILVVHDLYKLYGSLAAVNHLSFTVKREECFGLLGINGAGKTTTFKMIGGSVMPTAGTIVLDGYTFESDPYEYYRRLGYCPQENTHTKRITVKDNLRYYARINGVPGSLVTRTVRTMVEQCDLQDHASKFAENLSGGNQRKLSTAIALIGKKDLILLDEMSTGVDPVARRKLWKTVDFFKTQLKTSFILTSHSMDEVENLCSTISIMAEGKLKCIGSFNYLRDKYAQGFTILIKLKESTENELCMEQLKQRMAADFKGKASLKEFYMNTVVYIILSKVFKWPHLFRAMEQIKADLDLEDFLVSEGNMEAIFLSFTEQV